MNLSYAQRLEDFHLDLVLGERRDAFYVDIGGGHPVADNVSFHFYLKGWRGLVVEPQEDLAALYRLIRPRDLVANHLIGREDGEVTFHKVDRLHGFSTIIESHARGAAEFGAGYASERKPIRRLSGLLDEIQAPHVDFLKIDVEGAEGDVLSGLDWRRHRPSILCIEAIEPGSTLPAHESWEGILTGNGYLFAFTDELNRFYVRKEEEELVGRFPAAPTPWNAVTHFYELGRAHENVAHPDRMLTERLIKGFLATIGTLSEAEILALLAKSSGKAGLEQGEALQALLHGDRNWPVSTQAQETAPFDDRARAALGRIMASYDGGMISDD
ncbi:MAG: FkbM family methyltransferase [Proteobacteria bacterium]|nr:FkbM family methyltransferase [Pseudomonadota bacterium]